MGVNGAAAAQKLLSFGRVNPGYCLYYVWQAYKAVGARVNGSWPTAWSAWLTDKKTAHTDKNPPAGVPVYFAGGIILTNDEALAKKINSAIFPGIQGGPLMHVIAAKAVAFGEALRPSFKEYAAQVVVNARAMAAAAKASGLDVVSGGTDTHLALIDLRPKKVTGKDAEAALGRAFITCNKNGVPFDPEKPTITSGIRVGSPAGTTRGFGEEEFTRIGNWIGEIVDAVATGDSASTEDHIRDEVKALTAQYPIYGGLGG